MYTLTFLKILLGFIIAFIGLTCAIIELMKKRELLNWIFATFFIFAGIGFSLYVVYHSIFNNIDLVLAIMIICNISLNLSLSSLLLTSFIIEHGETNSLKKYVIPIFILFLISIVGYYFWTPYVDVESYIDGEVNTHTPMGLLIFITLYRLALVFYVQIKFLKLIKNAEGETKKRLTSFSWGVFLFIIGIFLFLIGNIEGDIGSILEIIGQIFLSLGIIQTMKGLIRKE